MNVSCRYISTNGPHPSYLRAHVTSLSSYAVVALTLASTLLASGVIGPDTTAYHLLGYVAAVLTALGFKALPAPQA